MMIEGVTVRQADALRAIVAHLDQRGVSPNYEELRAALGLGSRSQCHGLIVGLKQRGLVEWTPHRARSIVVTALGRERLGRPLLQLDVLAALPAALRASVESHCRRTGEQPADVFADAIKLHLDSFDLVEA